MKYLSGHLKNAVNVPSFQAFDENLRLRPVDELAAWLGAAGLDESRSPLLYDSYDGQNAAILAWILEYLGRTDVHVMQAFFESWAAEGREIFYKPVERQPRQFQHRINPSIRSGADEILQDPSLALIDFRSAEEFSGRHDLDGRPGHIPGAKNIVWRDLVDPHEGFKLMLPADPGGPRRIVAYCRSGLRAAVGYLVLQNLGYDVALYDGSYRDWIARGLPVEAA